MWAKLGALLAVSSCLVACDSKLPDSDKSADFMQPAESASLQPAAEHGVPAVSYNGMPIPGPRSCFWRYGPHSADPYINLAYPDAAVFYWAAVFSMPEGSRLQLSGDFAHARYQSFISYDECGRPIESLADYLMQPDSDSSNPYVPTTNRNSENRRYTVELINRKHGKVFMVRGKMPLIPKTYQGDDYMEEGQMRYWSICSNQGFANTRVNDCLFDEEIPLDENGFYTVMISRAADRPRNAIKRCGIAWLPMADDGDGMFDNDVTVVQIRQMLAAPEFEHAIQRVSKQSELERVLGPYMPRTRYLQPNQVETFFAYADPDYLTL